jgi:hypothetical protein
MENKKDIFLASKTERKAAKVSKNILAYPSSLFFVVKQR